MSNPVVEALRETVASSEVTQLVNLINQLGAVQLGVTKSELTPEQITQLQAAKGILANVQKQFEIWGI